MNERSLTQWERSGRRVAGWMAAVVVAGCASEATGVVTPAGVGSVSITPASPTLSVGAQVPLQAVVKDPSGKTIAGTDIFWSVQSPSIATVSSAGMVTGVAPGSTQVAASVNGKSGIATITVEKTPVTSVSVGSVTVAPNVDSVTTTGATSTTTVAATVKDANGTVLTDRIVNWTITPGAVASVAPSSGASTTVTGLGVGQAQVTATSETKTATASIKVMLAVTSVELSPAIAVLSVLTTPTVQLTATAKGADNTTVLGRTIAWTSNNTSVATVDATGKVTAKGTGVATVTATVVFDGVTSATPATITVVIP